MANKGTNGELIKRRSEISVEWKIANFSELSAEVDDFYTSPDFFFKDSSWYIKVYKNGEQKHKSDGWLGLYIVRRKLKPIIAYNYNLRIKKANGTLERLVGGTAKFGEVNAGYGKAKCLEMSELMKRESEFILSDTLTITCNLKDYCAVGGDKSVQTPFYMESNLGLENLSRDFSKLLDGQGDSLHDIQLKCGDHIHHVHRSILSSRSDVFAAMLHSGMTEDLDGLVEIKDVHPDIFQEFLGYLYSGKISSSLTFEKAAELYEVGDKYAITCLMDLCASFLTEHLTPENTLKCLIMADAHSDQDLKEKVISYILDKKIHLQKDVWLPFCSDHSKVAVEVLNRFCTVLNTS